MSERIDKERQEELGIIRKFRIFSTISSNVKYASYFRGIQVKY